MKVTVCKKKSFLLYYIGSKNKLLKVIMVHSAKSKKSTYQVPNIGFLNMILNAQINSYWKPGGRDPFEIDFLDFTACIFKAIEILTFTFFF